MGSLMNWHSFPGLDRELSRIQKKKKGGALSSNPLLSRRSSSLGVSLKVSTFLLHAPWQLPTFFATFSNPPPSQNLTGCFISFLLASALTPPIIIPPSSSDTFQNVPPSIAGTEKARRMQKPNSAKAESCTRKCVGTCIRGGGGAPGEGPLNVRRPLVVFKEGFRSRQYCLVECSDICNLIGDGDDGP